MGKAVPVVNRFKYGGGDVDCGVGKSRPTLRKLHQLHKSASVCDSTEIEVLRLRKVSSRSDDSACGGRMQKEKTQETLPYLFFLTHSGN